MIHDPHAFSRPFPAIPVAALALVSSACLAAQAAAPTPTPSTAPAATAALTAETSTEPSSVKAERICLKTEAQFSRDHDLTKAWNGFVTARRADPDYAPAWFNLAVMLENQKQWKQAQDYFYRYLALAPKGPDAVRAHDQAVLLNKYISGGMTPEDIKHADYDAAIQRARVLLGAGFYREAIADAGQAQAIDTSRWEAYAVVSLCMLRQRKLSQAARMRERAVQLAPADKRDQVRAALSRESTSEAHK